MTKKEKKKDFSALNANTQEGREAITEFNKAVEAKTAELHTVNTDPSIEQQYAIMCTAINHAVQKALPDTQKGKRIQRVVSKRTRDLYKKRTSMSKSVTKRTKVDYDASNTKTHQRIVHARPC